MFPIVDSEKSGVDEVDHFMTFHHYGDAMTLELVATAAEVLGEYIKISNVFNWPEKLTDDCNKLPLDISYIQWNVGSLRQ